jgi:CRISPR-associated protein Cas6/Cse3/CasE subtype I-E
MASAALSPNLFGLPANVSSRSTPDPRRQQGTFIHSVLGFTRLEIPQIELFEAAVTFAADTDPVTAHQRLADVFGRKAGDGQFLFRLDSAVAGRYWVRSIEPWTRWPEGALGALEPKREVIQLAEGLMYRFTLPVCAGHEYLERGEKRVVPFDSAGLVHEWFKGSAASFGIRPLMADIAMATLRFAHRGAHYKIQHAVIEGALEVADADALRRRLLKGFGSHRKVGLGMLTLTH